MRCTLVLGFRVLAILVFLGGCRAAAPPDGVGLEALSIAPRASASPLRRGFDSRNADLVPIRDWLRANIGGGADLTNRGLGPLDGDLTWAFGGDTIEFDRALGPTGGLRPAPRTLATPVAFATLSLLSGEIQVLTDDDVLGPIFAPSGPPSRCPAPPPASPSSALSAEVTRASLTMSPERTEVSWIHRRPACPEEAVTTNPSLRILTYFDADVVVEGSVQDWFDIDVRHVAVALDVEPMVCGESLGRPCGTSGVRTFDDYLSLLPGGRPASPPIDAVNADTHLELGVRAAYLATPGDVNVTVDPACPATTGLVGAILGTVIGLFAGPYGAVIGNAIGTVVGSLAGGIACGVLAASEVTPALRRELADTVAPLALLAGVMINPPTLRLNLRDALVAAADGLTDADGDGRPDDTDGDGAPDRPLSARNGITELAEANLLLGPTVVLSSADWLALDRASPDIPVGLEADAELTPGVFTQITSADGSFIDGAIVAIAGSATPTHLRVRRANVEFGALAPACAPAATRAADLPLLCMGCPPAAPASCPGPTCPAFCNEDGTSLVASLAVEAAAPLLELDFPPSPAIATLLSTAPMMATTIRRLLARPLPAGAYYTAAVGLDGGASFSYRVDPDRDLVDSSYAPASAVTPGRPTAVRDNCPMVFNPDQADDGDGDPYGAACDYCPGVRTFVDRLNADGDGDGRGYACDCDIDGDGCNNEGVEISATGAIVACVPSGDDYDPYPDDVGPDRNGDGVSDDCEPDLDGDGVPNRLDNCPIGDGDDDLTEDVDRNPDQTDSNGDGNGDLCDALCPIPGGPFCDAAERPFAPIDTGMDFTDLFPAAPGCLFDGPGCGFLALGACFPNDPGCLGGFEQLILVGLTGEQRAVFDAAKLGLDARFTPSIVSIDDIDGDARDDFAVGAPRASACLPGANKPDCVADAGVVLLVGSATETVLARIEPGRAGARFGTSIAFSNGVLAVGAPGARDGRGVETGAAYLFRVGVGGSFEALLPTFGRAGGDMFGTDVVAYPVGDEEEAQFVVGAPFADTSSIDAGQLVRIDGAAGLLRTYDGARARASLSHAVVVSRSSGPMVVGAAPGWKGAAGSLYFFDGASGRRRDLVLGTGSDGLGTTLVSVADAHGAGDVLAGAPGRFGGAGALDRYSLTGRRTSTTRLVGSGLGRWLSAPGDLDGDGARNIVAAVDLGDGRFVSVDITTLSTAR